MGQNDEIYIGDSSKVLCLRNSGQIKLLYGNRYINLFDSEGNLNAKIKDLIHVGPKPTNSSYDGFYFTPGSGNILPKFYIKQGNQILEVSNESSKTNLPEGSIIMYKGSLAPESEGWYKFNAPTNISGTIYIINKQGPEYQNPDLYDIWLDWLDTNDNRVITTTVKMGDNSFNWPQLKNLVNSNIQLLYEYSSSDIGVATINSSGVITLVSPGWTVIKAETQENGIHKYDYASYTLNVISSDKTTVMIFTNNNLSVASDLGSYTPSISITGASLSEMTLNVVSDPNNVVSSISGQTIMLSGNAGNADIRASVEETNTHKSGSVRFTLSVTAAALVQENISLSWSGSVTNGGAITLNLGDSITTLPSLTISGTSVDLSLFKRDYITYTKNGNNIATVSKGSDGNIVITLTGDHGEAQICAQCTATNEHSAAEACFTLKVNEVLLLSSFLTYKVGLISDVHYGEYGNPYIYVDGNNYGDHDLESLYSLDLNKILTVFKNEDVEFVASPGDLTCFDINDFIKFTSDYRTYWGDQNIKNFYCTIGNHDHAIIYTNTIYCRFYRYGYRNAYEKPDSNGRKYLLHLGIATGDHNGERWYGIRGDNSITKYKWVHNGQNEVTQYVNKQLGTWLEDGKLTNSDASTILNGGTNINFDCPGSLAGNDRTLFSNDSESYYITRNNGNDMFIFLSSYFGLHMHDETINGSDTSLIHPHNILSSNDVTSLKNVINLRYTYNFPGNDDNFNFLYFRTSDLLKLEELLRTNNSNNKRSFIILHFFFPHKAGGGNRYLPGTSSILSGITFHFLNCLNNTYKKSIWFSGHSHISWLENKMLKGLHWTNLNYPYVTPTTEDNNTILDESKYNKQMYNLTNGHNPYNREVGNADGTSAWNIHIPSMSRPKLAGDISDYPGCEAAIMTVNENNVVIEKIGYHTSNNGSSYTTDSITDPTLTIDTTTGNRIDTDEDIAPELSGGSTPSGGGSTTDLYITLKIDSDDKTDTSNGTTYYVNSKVKLYFTDNTYIYGYTVNSSQHDSIGCTKYNKRNTLFELDSLVWFPNTEIPDNLRYLWWADNTSTPNCTASEHSCPNIHTYNSHVRRGDLMIDVPSGYTLDTVPASNITLKSNPGCCCATSSDVNQYAGYRTTILSLYFEKTLSGRVDIYYYDANGIEHCSLDKAEISEIFEFAHGSHYDKNNNYLLREDKKGTVYYSNGTGTLKFRNGQGGDKVSTNTKYYVHYRIQLKNGHGLPTT